MRNISKTLIFFFIIIFILNPINVFARYYEKIGNIWCYMDIAQPIVEIEKSNTIVKEINSNSKIEEFYFTIKNYNKTKISEIDFLYDIEIKNANNNFPIEYKLYDCISGDEVLNGTNKTLQEEMKKYIKVNNKYRLVILWKDKINQNSSTDIDIIINVIQNI